MKPSSPSVKAKGTYPFNLANSNISSRSAWGMGALCGAGWMFTIVVGMIDGAG